MRIKPHPYPAYKPSGVDWIGDVPAHWEVRRIKTLLRELDVRSANGHGELLSLTRSKGLVPHGEASNRIASVEDLSGYKVCYPGVLVMNRMQAWSGMFAVASRDGLISPDYCVFSAVGVCDVRYFVHLFKTTEFVGEFARRSKGIGSGFNRLYTDSFGSVPLVVPPVAEQRAIVRYLDHVDRRIRRYVSAKRKLIALLEEEKQAVINQAVTRGLDPSVPLKPSGVEWLDDVPEHWERRRLKTILHPVDERSTSGSETLLSLRRDYGVVVYSDHFSRPSQSRSLIGFKLVDIGQLVVNRLQANNGLVFNSSLAGLVSPDYSVFQLKMPVNIQFLSDLLRTSDYRVYFRQNATGLGTGTAGFLRLYDDAFLRTPVSLPPNAEQTAIVEHLDKETADIDAATTRTHRQIELIEEYRTRLIADVVTGKLDVREAAAGLPEEAELDDGRDMRAALKPAPTSAE